MKGFRKRRGGASRTSWATWRAWAVSNSATAALAAGVSPQLIRLMGRWSSDIYEIYCRMSLQAALGVGRSIASQRVDSFEGGFRTESLEMLPHEVDRICAEESVLR